MWKLATLVGVASVLAACGDTEIGPDPDTTTSSSGNSMGGDGAGAASPGGGFESGSRLKLRTLVGTDGSRSPAGWYDSQLEVDCSFGVASDGSTRCLPASAPTIYFTNSTCTAMLAAAPCGAPPPPFVAVLDDDCAPGPRLFRVGNATSPATVYTKSIGGCIEGGPTGVQFYSVGDENGPVDFVKADAEIDD